MVLGRVKQVLKQYRMAKVSVFADTLPLFNDKKILWLP